jgi:hypothetical protein
MVLLTDTVCRTLRLIMERMLFTANCMVMQFHSDLTDAKEMVENLTAWATVLLNAIFWRCQGSFSVNCAGLFVFCIRSTGVDHDDGVARDPAHDWSSDEVLRDKEVSPIMSNWLLVRP